MYKVSSNNYTDTWENAVFDVFDFVMLTFEKWATLAINCQQILSRFDLQKM